MRVYESRNNSAHKEKTLGFNTCYNSMSDDYPNPIINTFDHEAQEIKILAQPI